MIDALYFTLTFDQLQKELGWDAELLKKELQSLIHKGWVKGLQRETEEEIDDYSQFERTYSLYLYLATKDGLMAHNSR